MGFLLARMGARDFARLSRFVYERSKIALPEHKRSMLEARLRKRLRALGLDSFEAYCDRVLRPQGNEDEAVHLIDAVTTNKTSFFREASQLEFLAREILPTFRRDRSALRQLRLWSAGCATGEEAYSLAMVVTEVTSAWGPVNAVVLGTDISTRALAIAARAMYPEDSGGAVPASYRKRYLRRGREGHEGLVRVASEVRELVRLHWLNLARDDFQIRQIFDVIFCRNVLIYFDRVTQERVIRRLVEQLTPDGYLVVGLSETLSRMDARVRQVGPMIYRKAVS